MLQIKSKIGSELFERNIYDTMFSQKNKNYPTLTKRTSRADDSELSEVRWKLSELKIHDITSH